MAFFSRMFGGGRSPLESYQGVLDEVNGYKDEVAGLSEEQIKAEVTSYKSQVTSLETFEEIYEKLMEIRPRVFALIREATKRTTNKPHFDVQLVGGFVLSVGKIAEMKTGEGKTQTAILPLVLYALAGKGVHLV